MLEWILDRVFFCLFHRFSAGVVHSFTDSAEDRDKLLTFNNIYIGESLYVTSSMLSTSF